MYEVETYTDVDGNRVTINYDERDYGDGPRDWDNLGVMACWHGRYELGDEQPKCSPDEYLEDLPEGTIILPLYLYDHGDITMSTSPFSCPWDSGQVGIIYATPERIRECFIDRVDDDRVRQALVAEVETYDEYLTGQVYNFVVESPSGCDHGDTHWEFVDSCGGFYGDGGIAEIKSQYPERVEVSA
jgi:hypothetical protein